MFGPGVKKPYRLARTPTAVDPRCVLHAPAAAKTFILSVNGFTYDMPAVLKIRNNTYLNQAIEDRDVGLASEQECLVLRRNDAVLDQNLIRTGLETPVDSRGTPLYTINDIAPNEDGVFTLYLETKDAMEFFGAGAINTDGLLTGVLMVTDNIEGCIDEAASLYNKIQNGRTGSGLAYDLPLDSLVPPGPTKTGCA